MASEISYTYGDRKTCDIKLIVTNDRNEKVIFLHSAVIKQYPPFKKLLSNISFPLERGIYRVTTKFKGNGYTVDDYTEYIKLMYYPDEKLNQYKFESVKKAISALWFASDYSFTKLADRCMCYLSCNGWSEGEEAKIRKCIILHYGNKPSGELNDRLSHSVAAGMVESFFNPIILDGPCLNSNLTKELIEECLKKGDKFRKGLEKCMKDCIVSEVFKLEKNLDHDGEFLTWLVLKAYDLEWFDGIEVVLRATLKKPCIVDRLALGLKWRRLLEFMLRGLKGGTFNYSAPMRLAFLKSLLKFMVEHKDESEHWKEVKTLWFEVTDGLPLFDQHELFEYAIEGGFNQKGITEWWQKKLIRAVRCLPNATEGL